MDKQEEAKQMFQAIRNAYAVLSDPQERAWYDSHKDSILRGGDGTTEDEDEEDETEELWHYFNSACYDGFGEVRSTSTT